MKKGQVNKVNRQSISIFNYYLEQLFPTLVKDFTPVVNTPHQHSVEHRNIAYHYSGDIAYSFSAADEETVLKAAREAYLRDVKSTIDQNSGFKEGNCSLKMLPISAEVLDHIDIVIPRQLSRQEEQIQHKGFLSRRSAWGSRKNLFCSPSKEHQRIRQAKSLKVKKQLPLQLYVIHRSTEMVGRQCLQWLNFIERYKFLRTKEEDDEEQTKVVYQVIFSYKKEKGLFTLDQSPRLLQTYFQRCCPKSRENKSLTLQKMMQKIDSVIQLQVREIKQQIEKASFHNSHRRSLRMTAEQKIILQILLPQAFKYFRGINPRREANNNFMEQTVSRMMENNNFDQKKSWQAVTYYLDFQKRMRDKYTWSDFRQLREMNFFTYIGKDKMGRPIILNRVRYTDLSKIKDKEKLFDFHFYLLQIYLQDQMLGWVDQFDAIADVADQTNDNTDIFFTKNLVFEMIKLTLGRSAHLVIFNLGLITKMFTKIIFPLLPESVLKVVNLFGQDGPELQEKLRELMTHDVIPDFIGGGNHDYNEGEVHESKKSDSVGGRSSDLTDGHSFRLRYGLNR